VDHETEHDPSSDITPFQIESVWSMSELSPGLPEYDEGQLVHDQGQPVDDEKVEMKTSVALDRLEPLR
jgi:hypothetical protein